MNDYTKHLKRLNPIIVMSDDGDLRITRIRSVYTNDDGNRMFEFKVEGEYMMIREQDSVPHCNLLALEALNKERKDIQARLERLDEIIKTNNECHKS